MTTDLLPRTDDASVYVPSVAHEEAIARARAAVDAERDARAAWEASIEERHRRVNAALESAPEDMSDNELARTLGLEPSTFRSMTSELRARRRRERARRES